jgi:hypothetical protein
MEKYYCCVEEIPDGSIKCKHCGGQLALPIFNRSVTTKPTPKNVWRELKIAITSVIIGVLIGGLVSFFTTKYFNDRAIEQRDEQIAKDKKEAADQTAQIIYDDVTDKLFIIYKYLAENPYNITSLESLKKLKDFSTAIYEAHLPRIGYLTNSEIVVVLRFYKCLIKANQALHEIRSEKLFSEHQKLWKGNLYDLCYKAIINGHHILKHCERSHDVERMGGMKLWMDKFRKTILERNPELEQEITLKPSSK